MSSNEHKIDHWGVDVRINGEDILTIESNCLFGKSDLSDSELKVIRTAAKHLLAFAGEEDKVDFGKVTV